VKTSHLLGNSKERAGEDKRSSSGRGWFAPSNSIRPWELNMEVVTTIRAVMPTNRIWGYRNRQMRAAPTLAPRGSGEDLADRGKVA
jgi:hypothetical protein